MVITCMNFRFREAARSLRAVKILVVSIIAKEQARILYLGSVLFLMLETIPLLNITLDT